MTETPAVLVVDDELGYREGVRRILAGRGLQAETAPGGAEALELFGAREFPIVLVDLKMPGVDGFELIRRLRERRSETLCIVVSAFATVESAVQTTKMGAFDFVVKPFAPDDLMVVVNRAVETWRLAQEAARLRIEREAHLLELAAEKSRLRTVLQAMGDGLLVINIDGEVVLDNPGARRLLRRVGEPFAGRIAEVLPDPEILGEVERLLAGEGGALAIEREVQLADRYLRVSLTPLCDGGERVLGVLALLSDVTESRTLERAKTLFVTMVAHELKAPIGAVEGYLHLIKGGSYDGDPEKLRRVASRCLERTGALVVLIQDLLEISRRQAGSPERRVESLDLGALCGALVEFHRPEAAMRKVELSLEVEAGLPTCPADRGDLERVVVNLLSNAIKYNREEGSVSLRVRRQGGALAIEISDTGIGMCPEELQRLGEEFFRAKNPRSRAVTGTGLGVALVKKIIESYQGELQVVSTPDLGSTFRVLLPLPPTVRENP